MHFEWILFAKCLICFQLIMLEKRKQKCFDNVPNERRLPISIANGLQVLLFFFIVFKQSSKQLKCACFRFDPADGLLHPSTVSFHADSLTWSGRVCLAVLKRLRLTHVVKGDQVTTDNLTLINLFLRHRGPQTESCTTTQLLIIQVRVPPPSLPVDSYSL